MGLLAVLDAVLPTAASSPAVVGIIPTVCINTGQCDRQGCSGSGVPVRTAGLREARC